MCYCVSINTGETDCVFLKLQDAGTIVSCGCQLNRCPNKSKDVFCKLYLRILDYVLYCSDDTHITYVGTYHLAWVRIYTSFYGINRLQISVYINWVNKMVNGTYVLTYGYYLLLYV